MNAHVRSRSQTVSSYPFPHHCARGQSRLKSQGQDMNKELKMQNKLLSHIGDNVDHVDSRVTKATDQVTDIIGTQWL